MMSNESLDYLEISVLMIFLAGIFDKLDGIFARKLNVASKFGTILDSLADFFNFGFATSYILSTYVIVHTQNNLLSLHKLNITVLFIIFYIHSTQYDKEYFKIIWMKYQLFHFNVEIFYNFFNI